MDFFIYAKNLAPLGIKGAYMEAPDNPLIYHLKRGHQLGPHFFPKKKNFMSGVVASQTEKKITFALQETSVLRAQLKDPFEPLSIIVL